jgi:tetratricopeptide (TPR) repeat protein
MNNNYFSYPAEDISSGLRTVFLYAATEDAGKLPALAERIAHPHNGTKCRVKWLNPAIPINEADLKNELSLSQVMMVYVTKSLVADIGELNHLPLPIEFLRENQKPYFPIADAAENLESYCKLDRPIHGLIESDPDFESKLKEQLSKYVLDEETLKEIREKGIINQIFLSYRKDDVIAAQNLMREIHNFKGFDAISIWYDRFLAAGNLFDNEILDAVDKSSAFTIVISPKIAAKREDGSDNYVVKHEYPRAQEKNKPIVPIHLPDYVCNHDDLKSVFKDIPELLAIEQTEPYLRSIFPDLPSVDTYSSERLYLLGRAYLSGFYFEQDSKKAVSLFQRAADHEDRYGLKSSKLLAELYESGDLVDGINYDEALKWWFRVAEISEKVNGKYDPNTAMCYTHIGLIYENKGNYDKALECYLKALEICEMVLGENHSKTALCYNNVGSVYIRNGDYEKALEYLSKAIEVQEKVLGKDHPKTAMSYNNIGGCYYEKRDYDKALEYHFMALDIRERVLGKEHPDTAMSYSCIGPVYEGKGDYDKALEYNLKALEIYEKILTKEHPTTALSYNNIGFIYWYTGDHDKALEYQLKALDIREKVLGKEHPDTAISYSNVGWIQSENGDNDKALEYYFKSLEILEKVFRKGHSKVAKIYDNIGLAYKAKGNYEKALEYHFKALEIRKKIFGIEHSEIETSYNNIGNAYNDKGDYEKAIEYLFKSIDIKEQLSGIEHPKPAGFYTSMGNHYHIKGDYEKALEYHFKALEVCEKDFGKEHKETASSYNNIAMTYFYKCDYDKALEYYKIAIDISKRVFGKDHPNVKILIQNAFSAFEARGKNISASDFWLIQLWYEYR